MPSDAPTPMIEPQEQDQLRAEVRALMQAESLSMKALATICGIPYGTFSSWLGGTYAGRTDRIAEQTRRGLDAHKAKARTRALAPKAPAFVPTPTAEAITGCLEHAQHMPEFVVVVGGPGIGKTAALMAYKAANPNVYLLTGEPVHVTPRALLDYLAETIGIAATGMSSERLSRAITAKLRNTGALVIMDEAQHLSSQMLDQLRTLHDLAGVGIALVGNQTIYARLEGGTRGAHYAQLFSRVGMRFSRAKPVSADIEMLLEAWGVDEKAERTLLRTIAKKPGALRGLTKVLRIAHMLAGAEGAEAVSERHIRMGWERYSSREAIEEPAKEAA